MEEFGGPLSARPLHLLFVLDISGSMKGAKIDALNEAMRQALGPMREAARANPTARLLVRALVFSVGARWHVADPTPAADFAWEGPAPAGLTDLGAALHLLASVLRMPPMDERALPPVLVLVSDGQPTDDWRAGLAALDALPWGRRAVRLAIAIGDDADLPVLEAFVGNLEYPVLQARDAETLASYIRWASTAVVSATSAPASRLPGQAAPRGNVLLPPPPEPAVPISATETW